MWSPPYWFVIVCLLVAKTCISNSPKPEQVQVGDSVPNTDLEMKDQNGLNVAAIPIPIPTFGAPEGLLSGGTQINGINENQRLFANGDSAKSKPPKERGMGLETGQARYRKRHASQRKRQRGENWRLAEVNM